jgi:hydroxymethylglutaryl-CoA synthase
MSGIFSYGVYIPRYRITLAEIAKMWHKNPAEIISALHVEEKSVPGYDEDAITLGVEAGFSALQHAKIQPTEIGSVFVGSESHPYAVNPSSSTIAEILGVGTNYFAADLEFACKAGTAGIGVTLGLLDSNKIKYGLVIGSDTAQAKPQDVLEFTAAAASAAYILGNKAQENIANVLEYSSYTSDTPDFWRRDGARYPSHAGRFSGEPAYFHHIMHEGKKLLDQSHLMPKDFSYCVFHMPNGKFPRSVAKKLGFTEAQLKPSLIVDAIGNPYSASSLVGLAAVLDIAKPHEKIFVVSYGSGAGSDGFIFETTPQIEKRRRKTGTVKNQLQDTKEISYMEYLKQIKTL